jgi:hypothetical protein
VHLDTSFTNDLGEPLEPYERLLHDAIIGDANLFAREDSIEQTWRIVQPLLDHPHRSVVTDAARGGRPKPTHCCAATSAGSPPGWQPAAERTHTRPSASTPLQADDRRRHRCHRPGRTDRRAARADSTEPTMGRCDGDVRWLLNLFLL